MTDALAKVFLDTETTGLYPRLGHEIWEFAAIRVEPGEPDLPVFTAFQIVADESRADPKALEVSRWHERRWEGALVSRADAAQEITRVTDGAVLYGAVPAFDAGHMDRLLYEGGRRIPAAPWHYQLQDVETLAAGYLAGHTRRECTMVAPWDSDELSRAIGVEPADEHLRHTAMGDALWVARIYYQVMTGTIPNWAHGGFLGAREAAR